MRSLRAASNVSAATRTPRRQSQRRRLGNLVVVAICASIAAGALAGAARAVSGFVAQPSTSSNWAGYVATGPGSTATTASPEMTYTDVTGQWVEPKADCNGSPTSVALWVGLGGFSVGSQELEQAGTAADCLAGGKASYYAWYELVPADAVTVPLKVDPGDVITSSVVLKGSDILVQVIDRTRGQRFTKLLPMSDPDLSSAEWIAEAPAACDQAGRCRQLGLTWFGPVNFTHTYATGNGVGGTITAASWTATAIELVPSSTQRVFGETDGAPAASPGRGAMPVMLAPDGSGFTVVCQNSTTSS